MIREQLLREIEESFINAFNKGRIAKISKSELTEMFSMMLEEENYE